MVDINVKLRAGRTIDVTLDKAFHLASIWLAEAIAHEIKFRAHKGARPRTRKDLPGYYSDGSMPYYSGELLQSVKAVADQDGAKVTMLSYGKQIDEGDVRVEIVGQPGDKLYDWIAFQGHGKRLYLGEQYTVGAAHPFINVAVQYVVDKQAQDIVKDAIYVYSQNGPTG